jgi:hypothetical protein
MIALCSAKVMARLSLNLTAGHWRLGMIDLAIQLDRLGFGFGRGRLSVSVGLLWVSFLV